MPRSVYLWLPRASGGCRQRTVASSLSHREATLSILRTVLFDCFRPSEKKIATLIVGIRIRALRQRGYCGGPRTVFERSDSAIARAL